MTHGCPHAPRCVPCPLRGRPYRAQLALKRERVVAALAVHPELGGARVEDTVGSRDLFGYRSVAKLAVRPRPGGGLRAGVYEPGSHRLADADGCEVHHPDLNRAIRAVLDEAARLGLEAFDEERGTGDLRYLVARRSAWQRRVLLVLVTGRADVPGLRELAKSLARRHRFLGGILQNVNGERGNVILGRSWRTLRPPAEMVERIGGLRLATSPAAFLQVNVWTARRIYETTLEWLAPGPEDRVVDVYSGVGPLALHLAGAAREVVGIEEVPQAVADARANARRNGVGNARFVEGRAEDVLGTIERADLASVNPPRKGAAPGALEALARLRPRRIAYVSCDPTTLARDLAALAALGWRTTLVRPFDMMPQTEHVEVVALCER